MKNLYFNSIRFLVQIGIVVLVMLSACNEGPSLDDQIYNSKIIATSSAQTVDIAVAPPPFSEDIFPCSECHADQETDPERRELFMHEEIDQMFDHDKENRWCLDCHNPDNRDFLKLASGKLVSFEESYKLCGQCHGDKLRDWKVGVHGKRTGEWNGKKQYLLCVNCHNPHSPHFKPLKPMPPPIPQSEIKLKD